MAIDCGAACHKGLFPPVIGQGPRLGFSRQRGGSSLNGEVYGLLCDVVVPAGVVGNGDLGGAHRCVVAVLHRVLAGRNLYITVLDHHVGLLRGAVVVEGLGGQIDLRICHLFRLDGHLHANCGTVLVVAVGIGLGLVPDGVGTRVSLLGNVQRVVGTVPGIGEGTVCRRDAGDQRLRIAVVGQLRICRSCQTGGLRGDGGCRERGKFDVVPVVAGEGTGNGDGLVRSHISVAELAGQNAIKVDGVTIQQVAVFPPDNQIGAVGFIIHLVPGGHDGRDRLLFRAERPGVRNLAVVAVSHFFCRDRNRAGLVDSYQAAVVNGGNLRVTARPRHSPCYGTAHRTEGKAVSVLDLSGLIRDRQRALPRYEDGECLFCLGEGIISATFFSDLDLVVSGFRPVPGPVIDGVLCCRDHALVVVLDRDRRFMLFAVIGSPPGVELNGEVGHSLRGDGHCSQLCACGVVVVAVALHAVPDIVVACAGAGGEAGGVGLAVQRVFHDAVR